MKTLIFCNRLSLLREHHWKFSAPLRFISLIETLESNSICTYLRQLDEAEELPKAELFRERSTAFREKYIQFMGRLNVANRSPDWWGLRFTTKNPLSTTLCRNVSSSLLLAELMEGEPRALLVITDNADLVSQVKLWARGQNIKVVDLLKLPGATRRWFRRTTPAGILRASLRTGLIWWRARRYRPSKNSGDAHIVITTLTHPHSFPGPSGYRDSYFGALVQQLPESGLKPLVLAMPVERPLQQLKKFDVLKGSLPLVPMEACLTLSSLAACVVRSLVIALRPWRVKGSMEIDGVDLGCLVRRATNEARRSGDMLLDKRIYYCAGWLARNIRVTRWLYPFENRAFEKMLLLGVRSRSPETEMVGYQHASITLSHTNFILHADEAKYTPLPDSILTTGEVITRWLEGGGNYPEGIFKTACALRQGQQAEAPAKAPRAAKTRVLAALATNMEEYVGTLVFLEKASAGLDGFDLRIRPHPEYSLETAVAMAPLSGEDFYTKSTGTLAEDLAWADVVLYASSTVGLEAVSMGIPAVYLDLGTFLDTDPMSGWSGLRWPVKDPSVLAETIRRITELPDHEFKTLQQEGRDYAASYLKPVTAGGLEKFWDG